jgi:putative Ca2+/H+ antiporter (TMEM165/GDT1 family)
MTGHGSGFLGFSITFAVHLLASQFSKRPIISTAIAIIVIGTTLALPVGHTAQPPAPPAPTVPANWRSMR